MARALPLTHDNCFPCSLLVAPLTALTVSAFGGSFVIVNAALLAVTVAATPALWSLDRRQGVVPAPPRDE